MSFLETITQNNAAEAGTEPEPSGEDYRPVWRMTRPPTLDLRIGGVQFNVSYAHSLVTVSGIEHYSAFWLIQHSMTFVCEGENLHDVIQSIGDRKARALFLFEPDRHKTWDEKQGRILHMQPVFVSSEAALARAADIFGFKVAEVQRTATVPAL